MTESGHDGEAPPEGAGEIRYIKVESEFRICPACGYERGFHTSFLNINANRHTPIKSTREVYKVILICPECGARYDIGWKIPFGDLPGVTLAPSVNMIPPVGPSHNLPDA
jgi:hypothetical protein